MFITIDKEDVKSTIKRYYEEVEGDRVDVRFYTYDADYSYQANGVFMSIGMKQLMELELKVKI